MLINPYQTTTLKEYNNVVETTPEEYVSAIDSILLGQFTPVEQVRSPSANYINLGLQL